MNTLCRLRRTSFMREYCVEPRKYTRTTAWFKLIFECVVLTGKARTKMKKKKKRRGSQNLVWYDNYEMALRTSRARNFSGWQVSYDAVYTHKGTAVNVEPSVRFVLGGFHTRFLFGTYTSGGSVGVQPRMGLADQPDLAIVPRGREWPSWPFGKQATRRLP